MKISPSLYTVAGASKVATLVIILLALYVFIVWFGIHPLDVLLIGLDKFTRLVGRRVNRLDERYKRNVEVGKLRDGSNSVRLYKFMNDLTIDLGYKRKGVTPYELMLFILVISVVVSLLIGEIVFRSLLLSFLAFIPVLLSVCCILYTKANISHDSRIEAVILAENIISANIDRGVVVAIRTNIESMPISIKSEFTKFLDRVETQNYYIETALLELGASLGSISDDFISKCITFELEEEAGLAGIFKDVVEVNNIKTELRIDMKHQFEAVTFDFIISATMVFVFLIGAIAIYPILQRFYFRMIVGQLLLLVDFMLVVFEFVYITYLRAKEV